MQNDFLTVDEISMLHEKLIDATGGAPGLRDRGPLKSAVVSVNAGFEDMEQYSTAAVLCRRSYLAVRKGVMMLTTRKSIRAERSA